MKSSDSLVHHTATVTESPDWPPSFSGHGTGLSNAPLDSRHVS
jgi:hypothetical protein